VIKAQSHRPVSVRVARLLHRSPWKQTVDSNVASVPDDRLVGSLHIVNKPAISCSHAHNEMLMIMTICSAPFTYTVDKNTDALGLQQLIKEF